MTINEIKNRCVDFSPNAIRDKYYAQKHKRLTIHSLLWVAVIIAIMLYGLSQNKHNPVVAILIITMVMVWHQIIYIKWDKLDSSLIKNYYHEYATDKLLNGNYRQKRKETTQIFMKISRKMWREFCLKNNLPLDCKSQYEIRTWLHSSITPTIINTTIIKEIIALLPLVLFTIIDANIGNSKERIGYYILGIIIYIGILSIYERICSMYLESPYRRYKRLLKIIDAEMADSPILFKK